MSTLTNIDNLIYGLLGVGIGLSVGWIVSYVRRQTEMLNESLSPESQAQQQKLQEAYSDQETIPHGLNQVRTRKLMTIKYSHEPLLNRFLEGTVELTILPGEITGHVLPASRYNSRGRTRNAALQEVRDAENIKQAREQAGSTDANVVSPKAEELAKLQDTVEAAANPFPTHRTKETIN